MTSIALTNANNCQNQGKGCSTPTPTRLVGIFQRAFEEQVKKKVKRKLSIAAIPASKIPPVLPSSPSEREKEAQTNKECNHFLCRCAPRITHGELRGVSSWNISIIRLYHLTVRFHVLSASLTRDNEISPLP